MSPVSPEGWRESWIFLGAMFGGALAAALICLSFLTPWLWLIALAPVVFIGATAWGAWRFISISKGRGDSQHTIDEYRTGKVKLVPEDSP